MITRKSLIQAKVLFYFTVLAFCLVTADLKCAAINKNPITVDEAIQMTRLGDEAYFSGTPSKTRVAHFSPDGKYFVILLRKGNLRTNSNEFSLLLFRTTDVFTSPKLDVLLTFSSLSNKEGISDIKWMRDNETLTFLGVQQDGVPQVYTFGIRSRKLRKLTNNLTSVSAYDITPDARKVLYLADPPPKNSVNSEEERREGIVITNQFLIDILAGNCAPSWWTNGERLFLQIPGRSPVPIPMRDYLYPESNFMSLSPNGRYALVRSWVPGKDVPKEWTEYESQLVRERSTETNVAESNSGLMRFLLLDTKDGSIAPLLNTPMEWYNDTATWAPDSQSIYLTTRLPLSGVESSEYEERKKNLFDVEIKLPSKEIRKTRSMSYEDAIVQEIQKRGNLNGPEEIDVTLAEDVNTPPRIYVANAKTKEKCLLLDLNPQFVRLDFGKVQTIEWESDGIEFVGGLYLPPDYTAGVRYPLVIQTHGFTPDRFSMDGANEWSSGFAARPLTANGFLVLQTYGFKNKQDHDRIGNGTDKRFGVTPAQSARRLAQAAYEGAIDYLDVRGMIDRNRVGISGFSRTVASVAYTLTHTEYRFGAAILTDGADGGYFQQIVYPSAASDGNAMNGGVAPFGEGIETWLKESPSFNLNKVQTPVRLVALGPSSVLGLWEWFSGLALQGKPVELIEIPDGAHLLEKPWERRIAMEGIVDWFRFWLKGETDLDAAKGPQYARWRKLKKESQK